MTFSLLDILSALIGGAAPAFLTWRATRTKGSTKLVTFAKYWIVFSLFMTVDTVAQALYFTEIVPAYRFLKFICTIYICLLYENLYHKFVHPYFKKNEKQFMHAIDKALDYGRSIGREILYPVNAVNNALGITPMQAYDNPAIITGRSSIISRRTSTAIPLDVDDEDDADNPVEVR